MVPEHRLVISGCSDPLWTRSGTVVEHFALFVLLGSEFEEYKAALDRET